MTENKKPDLTLVKPVNVEALVALYRKLTGREPTAEEIEKAKAVLAKKN